MAILVHAVMCGGAGTRLWPWSRVDRPKPFLSLLEDASLLQTTVDRLAGMDAAVSTFVLGADAHRFLIAEQLRGARMTCEAVLLEPQGRNTAPAAIIAALAALDRSGPDAVVLLSPADHHIADAALYRAMIGQAMGVARDGRIVTFGVPPDHASTAFGYIGIGDALRAHPGFHAIDRFTEKPEAETAEAFLQKGGYLWNSGMFLFAPETLLDLAASLRPDMVDRCRQAYGNGRRDGDVLRLEAESFSSIVAESFDRAIMENIGAQGAVTAFTAGWSDIGSWEALRMSASAEDARSVNGGGRIEAFGCDAVFGLSDGPLIVANGLKDTVIVASSDTVYVGAARASEALSEIVPDLERRGLAQASRQGDVHRPWGSLKRIASGEGYDVSELDVRAGGQLSLPEDRSEHWVVVRGAARATLGEDVRLLREGESVYVPAGTRRRLENPGDAPLHVIAVRTGGDLAGDDDITRAGDSCDGTGESRRGRDEAG